MGLIGNITTDFKNALVQLAGILFTAQASDSLSGTGKPRLWVKSGDKKVHYTDTDGADDVLAVKAYVDAAVAPGARRVNTTEPITGGGDLTADRTLALTMGASGDIAAIGAAKSAGAVGKVADAGHVHQFDKAALRSILFTGVDASGGASHVTIGALKANDQIVSITNLTDLADGAASFEASTVAVNGQLQQPATDLSTKKFLGLFVAKS